MTFGGEEIDLNWLDEVVAWQTRGMPFTSPNACVVAWREGEGYKILLLHPEEKEPKEMKALVGERVKTGIIYRGSRSKCGGHSGYGNAAGEWCDEVAQVYSLGLEPKVTDANRHSALKERRRLFA